MSFIGLELFGVQGRGMRLEQRLDGSPLFRKCGHVSHSAPCGLSLEGWLSLQLELGGEEAVRGSGMGRGTVGQGYGGLV